jgi:hypothetical protein
MTEPLDPFESDLRTMLAERAGTVTADTQTGEAAVTARLVAGDTGLAEVVALPSTRRGPVLLIGAAAVLLLVAVLAAVVMASDDDQVRTGPVATAPPPRAAVVELRPVLRTGPCAELGASAVPSYWGDQDCYLLGDALPASDLIESALVSTSVSFSGEGVPIGCEPDCPTTTTSTSEESHGVTLVLTDEGIQRFNELASSCFASTATCPTGQLAILVDGRVVSTPSIVVPSFEEDSIEITGPFTEQEAEELAALLDPSTATSSEGADTTIPSDGEEESFRVTATVGEPGESAKDVAERVALAVFGEPLAALDASESGLVTLVTLGGPGGNAIAEVAFDEAAGGERLVRIAPRRGASTDHGTMTDGSLSFDVPEPGDLTYALLDLDLQELVRYANPGVDGGVVGILGPVGEDAAWLSVRLDTPDGRVLLWLSSLGD